MEQHLVDHLQVEIIDYGELGDENPGPLEERAGGAPDLKAMMRLCSPRHSSDLEMLYESQFDSQIG